jgi:hypothetical protein
MTEDSDPPGALFHRPLDGVGQEITGVRLAGVLENIFIFTGDLADESAYEIPEQVIRDTNGKTRVIWRPPHMVSPPLYPVGLADLLGRRDT